MINRIRPGEDVVLQADDGTEFRTRPFFYSIPGGGLEFELFTPDGKRMIPLDNTEGVFATDDRSMMFRLKSPTNQAGGRPMNNQQTAEFIAEDGTIIPACDFGPKPDGRFLSLPDLQPILPTEREGVYVITTRNKLLFRRDRSTDS